MNLISVWEKIRAPWEGALHQHWQEMQTERRYKLNTEKIINWSMYQGQRLMIKYSFTRSSNLTLSVPAYISKWKKWKKQQ